MQKFIIIASTLTYMSSKKSIKIDKKILYAMGLSFVISSVGIFIYQFSNGEFLSMVNKRPISEKNKAKYGSYTPPEYEFYVSYLQYTTAFDRKIIETNTDYPGYELNEFRSTFALKAMFHADKDYFLLSWLIITLIIYPFFRFNFSIE